MNAPKPYSRIRSLTACLLVFFLLSPPVYAAQNGWVKLGRGMMNVLTGFYEIPYQVMEIGKTERWPIAVGAGLGKGLYRGVLRTLTGVYEVVTFPVPLPPQYRPIMYPEFIVPPAYPPADKWTDWGDKKYY